MEKQHTGDRSAAGDGDVGELHQPGIVEERSDRGDRAVHLIVQQHIH
jgi:hypothetical protein